VIHGDYDIAWEVATHDLLVLVAELEKILTDRDG
jgi:hypothetical protein